MAKRNDNTNTTATKETKMETTKQIEARRVKRQLKQTAAERYADHQADIGILLDLIGEELKVHAEEAANASKDWGLPGDLGRIRNSLKGILRPLLAKGEWTETESSRFIEDHLEAMRD